MNQHPSVSDLGVAMAEVEDNLHDFVFIHVKSPENDAAGRVCTVTHKHRLWMGPFVFFFAFRGHHSPSLMLVRRGCGEGVEIDRPTHWSFKCQLRSILKPAKVFLRFAMEEVQEQFVLVCRSGRVCCWFLHCL